MEGNGKTIKRETDKEKEQEKRKKGGIKERERLER